ncbi:hypothetical protein [Rhizorhabdus sp.]|uniref:hypothetical protein n=1 Tax=Rhizorhabdus sp. TaxID=1968843 RepID=UPI0035B4376B
MSRAIGQLQRLGPDSLAIKLPDGRICQSGHASAAVVSAIGLEHDDEAQADFVSFCLAPSNNWQGLYVSLTPDQARTFATLLNNAADMVEGGLPTGQVQ